MSRLSDIVNQLDSLGVQCVELQFTLALTDTLLFKVLDSFHESSICSLEILCIKKSVKAINYSSIFLTYPRVTKVTMYESEEYNKSIKDGISYEFINAGYKPELCGTISHKSLLFSIPFFMEAQFYNVCLNRKICIDENGDIKSCPMSDMRFGNILSDRINFKKLISSTNFNFFTKIKKDDIEICKVCEFRYACPDCRICRHNLSNTSAPAKCQYNPFLGKWKGENDFISVLDMGEYDSDGKFILYKT
jgi:SPASM domain peptide maturase of grasp-with-spasm system